MQQFGLQPLVHQFVQAFAKNVGLPDLNGVCLKILQQAPNQLFGLFLTAHNGRDLRVNGGFQ